MGGYENQKGEWNVEEIWISPVLYEDKTPITPFISVK
jgi:hypothetical protein